MYTNYMNSIQPIRTIVKEMNTLNRRVIIFFNRYDAIMFINHKFTLLQYINSYLISPSIIVQACPSNITGRKGAKEEGAVVPEPLNLHYSFAIN